RFVRDARSGPSTRTHAAARQESAALAEDLHVRSVHALDRCRTRPWSVPLERRRARLAARRLPVHVAAGYALGLWPMHVNPFFSSVIRIQTDRGQHVVTTGPYAFVRHPGYIAGILIIAASGPALGSWLAAALLVVFILPFLLHRAIMEDRILQVELAGYSAYAALVRWQLLPGIW